MGFGPGQILGCVSSLLWKRPLFVSLPLFAASHARSPSLRCSSAPSPAGTSLSTSTGAGAAGNSPMHMGPTSTAGGRYGGVKGCTGLGNRPCKPRAHLHCFLVPRTSGAFATLLSFPVPLGSAHAAELAQVCVTAPRMGNELLLPPGRALGAPGGCGMLCAGGCCSILMILRGISTQPLAGLLWPRPSTSCRSKVPGTPLEQCHTLSPRPCPSATPHPPAPHPGAAVEPLLRGGLGRSRVCPAFRFSCCSPRSHSLVCN